MSLLALVGQFVVTVVAAIFALNILAALCGGRRAPASSGHAGSLVKQPVGLVALQAAITGAPPRQVVLVDYFATWCGPCVAVAPFVEDLAARNPDVLVLKVQEDQSPDVIRASNIRAFPTFRFYVDNKCVGELLGADRAALTANVARLKAAAAAGEPLEEVKPSAGGGGCVVA